MSTENEESGSGDETPSQSESSSSADSSSTYQSADTSYPENQYVMDVEAFVSRENDEYIEFIYELIGARKWPASAPSDPTYDGFTSGNEFNSSKLFNIFFAAIDSDNYKSTYYQDDKQCYVIPVSDINAVLDKYFIEYELDIHDTTANYTYLEDDKYICLPGYLSIIPPDYGHHIDSVTDNGDGTVTVAIVEDGVAQIDDDLVYTGKDGAKVIFTLEPGDYYCHILSCRIERPND
ncbi:MAG: hypothetical protein ACI4IT_05365 [Oscillospiraceae bacterium]